MCLPGSHGGVKAAHRQSQDLEHMPLLGLKGGALWGSQVKARVVNSNEKEPRFCRRKALGNMGGC